MHFDRPDIWEIEEGDLKFKVILSYIGSLRPAWAIKFCLNVKMGSLRWLGKGAYRQA